jgi:hypothetical protein
MIARMRALLLILLSFIGMADARPKLDIRGTLGSTELGDDGLTTHMTYGGSARIYLTERFSIEPEAQYLHQSDLDKDVALVANAAFDFRKGPARMIPYAIGGVGWLHGIRRFGSLNETITSAGAGMKIFLTEKLYVSPGLRLGWPPHVRVSVTVGWSAE